MVEIISGLFSNFGIPGIIIAFLFYCLKNNPITSLSSSAVEIKLATKEKRFYVSAVKYILSIIFYAIILTVITIAFITNGDLYSYKETLIFTIISIAMFLWVTTLDANGKTFSTLSSRWRQSNKWMLFLIFLINFISLFLIIAYYIGEQIYLEYLEVSIEERVYFYIGLIILYSVLAPAIHSMIVDTYLRFLEIKNNNKYTLVVNIDDEKWFLFHPIDKGVYLLGNKPILEECTKFTFLERNELLNQVLEIEN